MADIRRAAPDGVTGAAPSAIRAAVPDEHVEASRRHQGLPRGRHLEPDALPQLETPAQTALQACGSERLSAYEDVLRSLRATSLRVHHELAPVRAWCGAELWPGIVRRDLAPLLSRATRFTAVERVEAMLDAEMDAPQTFCHGDFGPHNILWAGERVDSVIDFDHACIGDPVIDLAPLISFHGASGVMPLGESEEIRRAMLHRATLRLQVAAAAHLAGLGSLRNHALGNFERRAVEGTLFDPSGERPD
nr:aminoglycoside phosphotransferase family protein [Brachybacterium fresconis]